MKTVPMGHQLTARQLLRSNPYYYALACEQGTGKTWMLLDDIETQFTEGRITGVLILAPKGVHTNWIKREIPTHLSIPFRGVVWKSGPGKLLMQEINNLNTVTPARLAILAMNIDAINTKTGFDVAMAFIEAHKAMLIIDESQRIKSHDAARTKKAIRLGEFATSRRIASGTIVTQGPQDIFSQFSFLEKGLVGTTSYRAFVTEYADVLPPDNPIVKAAMRGNAFRAPLIIRTDFNGMPIYKNTDKLHRIISPYMYRVTKDECLDLPEKIYTTIDFDLAPQHRREYDSLRNNLRIQYSDGDVDTFTALTIITKLRQAAAGYILRDGEPVGFEDGGARVAALNNLLDDLEGQAIIWASFRFEIAEIVANLRARGETVVEYHGGTSTSDRDHAIDSFQNGTSRFFVSNPAAGGVGITLTNAKSAIYFGNSPSLEHRLQSEDRCHRIGLRHNVLYIDLVASGTIDERIAMSLQRKELVAREIIDGAF